MPDHGLLTRGPTVSRPPSSCTICHRQGVHLAARHAWTSDNRFAPSGVTEREAARGRPLICIKAGVAGGG